MSKRLFDILASAVALLLLAPLLLLCALAVRLSMGTPVFFRQRRPGLHGRSFTLIKFRTMTVAPDGQPQSDAARITTLGRWLRASSLDELPELWCVLKGEMSLVGPRPLLEEYLPLYSAEQARRHQVRPGLTGWAQVHGRNALDWEERFALDVWYVDHRSFWLDLKILGMTLATLISARGVSHPGHVTMPPFRGSVSRPPGAEP